MGHFWHLFRPQEAPTLPQQSSCLVRPGRGLPHCNNTQLRQIWEASSLESQVCACMLVYVQMFACWQGGNAGYVTVCVQICLLGQNHPDILEISFRQRRTKHRGLRPNTIFLACRIKKLVNYEKKKHLLVFIFASLDIET